MRNEEASIEHCLESLASQDYEPLEVLIYDGHSTDRSWDLAEPFVRRHRSWRLRPNPRRIQAAAWNLGIDESTGDVIGIVSAHSELASDYVSQAVASLERTGATMVGGPVRAIPDGFVAGAIAMAISTPFGVGGARHHYTDVETEVDTVFMGVAAADVYRRFRFDERMVRNQDDELSYRILDAGGRIVCSPAIRSRYRARATLASLARQYWAYGYWKVEVLRRHPAQARPRHLLPAAFVASGVSAALAGLVSRRARRLAGYGAALYLAANGVASVLSARRHPAAVVPVLSASFAVMHTAYGAGFISAAVARGVRRLMQHRRTPAGPGGAGES